MTIEDVREYERQAAEETNKKVSTMAAAKEKSDKPVEMPAEASGSS
jgi:hypothetical protein